MLHPTGALFGDSELWEGMAAGDDGRSMGDRFADVCTRTPV